MRHIQGSDRAQTLLLPASVDDDGVPRAIAAEVQQTWRGYIEYLMQSRPTTFSLEVGCSAEAREQFRLFYNQVIDHRLGGYADVEGELSRCARMPSGWR